MNDLKASYATLPHDADGQVDATIARMREYVIADSSFPQIVNTAKRLMSQCTDVQDLPQMIWQEANGRLDFQIDQITASEKIEQLGHKDIDPADVVEVLVRPADVELLTQDGKIVGDCDDFSMYVACLALAIAKLGAPITDIRFVTISDNADGVLVHVYVSMQVQGQYWAIDASHGSRAGWEAGNATRRVTFPIEHTGFSSPMLMIAAAVGLAFLMPKKFLKVQL